ncbi:MAG: hypothetical protein OEW91_17590 [Acidimicrobiia bacterium]|nr:hypothetical protein [Acidimicrobiia bacterium]
MSFTVSVSRIWLAEAGQGAAAEAMAIMAIAAIERRIIMPLLMSGCSLFEDSEVVVATGGRRLVFSERGI